ncbi:MAG TPA: hypothetical protein VII50_03310 [Acidothermaceae bacterium]
MALLAGDAARQRHTARGIMALTQGISGSSWSDSGLRSGSTRDSCSPKDIAAMKNVSGCHEALAGVVEHSPI